MLRFKYWIRNFFGFPRAQVNGFVILLILVSLSLFSEPAWRWFIQYKGRDFTSDKQLLDSLLAKWDAIEPEFTRLDSTEKPARRLFKFDPNKVTPDDLTELGFPDHMVKRIVKYREKGGRFRIKSDLSKIYGLDSALYLRLYPFISLADRKDQRIVGIRKFPINQKRQPREKPASFDLNTADTSQLKQINGIGDKLSLRIVKYRDAIGGFVKMEQLKEVYGLDTLVIRRLIENSMIRPEFEPAKIDLNTASEKQLADHPYLRKVAKSIVSYRFQHGSFKTVDEIRNIASIDDDTVQKITPYVKVGNSL